MCRPRRLFYRRRPVEAWAFELAAVLGTALVPVPVSPAEPWPWAVTSIAALTAVAGLVATLGDAGGRSSCSVVLTGLGLLLTIWPARGDWVSVAVTTVFCGVGVVVGDIVGGRRTMAVELAAERQVSAAERGAALGRGGTGQDRAGAARRRGAPHVDDHRAGRDGPLPAPRLLVPGPLGLRLAMVLLVAIVGAYFSLSYVEESCELRAVKHGHPHGAAKAVRDARGELVEAAAAARYAATYRVSNAHDR